MPEPDPEQTRASAETSTESPEGIGRRRMLDALLKPSRAQVVVGILLAFVGFAAITQVRSNELDDTYAGYREQDLIDVLNGLTVTSQRAEAELARLERTRADLESNTSERQAALTQARERTETLSILAGTVPVTGPGIRITIEDETGRASIDSMLDTIQELRTAGAEAMEFNDQVRLIAQSSFEDGVGGIYVDDVLLTSPYVIDVIGEPNTLEGGLNFLQGPVDALEEDGATVEIEAFDELDIESVRDLERSQYAAPDDIQ